MGAPAKRAGLPVTPSAVANRPRATVRNSVTALSLRATSDGCWGALCEGSVRRGPGRLTRPTRARLLSCCLADRRTRAQTTQADGRGGNRASRDEPGQPNTPVCSFCTNYLLQRQHLRREDRGSDSNPVSLVQMRLVPAVRPAQAPHFDASAGLLAALVAVPSTLDLRPPL